MIPRFQNQAAFEELVDWVLDPSYDKPTQKAFAEAHGISERQVIRWLQSDEFRDAIFKRAPKEMVQFTRPAFMGLLAGVMKGNPKAFEKWMLWVHGQTAPHQNARQEDQEVGR
jgi:hypothetical protein